MRNLIDIIESDFEGRNWRTLEGLKLALKKQGIKITGEENHVGRTGTLTLQGASSVASSMSTKLTYVLYAGRVGVPRQNYRG